MKNYTILNDANDSPSESARDSKNRGKRRISMHIRLNGLWMRWF